MTTQGAGKEGGHYSDKGMGLGARPWQAAPHESLSLVY